MFDTMFEGRIVWAIQRCHAKAHRTYRFLREPHSSPFVDDARLHGYYTWHILITTEGVWCGRTPGGGGVVILRNWGNRNRYRHSSFDQMMWCFRVENVLVVIIHCTLGSCELIVGHIIDSDLLDMLPIEVLHFIIRVQFMQSFCKHVV